MEESPVESDAAAAPQAKAQARQTDSLVDEAARVASALNDRLPTLSQESRVPDNHNAARQPPPPQLSTPEEEAEAFGADALPPFEREESGGAATKAAAVVMTTAAAPPEGDAARGRMRQRAASVGASVGGNLRPRVEKLREASTIVVDEATDDPGLRFVIVALVLFLLFLFILLFSYILG